MADIPDVASPGGWLQLYGARVARALVLGVMGGVSAALTIYGTLNGGQAAHYCEASLVSKTATQVTYSCINPLNNESGAIMKDSESFLYVSRTPSPVTRLDAGLATTATASGQDLFNNVDLNAAKRVLTVTGTGALGASNHLVIAPANSAGKKYLNFTFSAGSGQTVDGTAPAYVRVKIIPCNLSGVGC